MRRTSLVWGVILLLLGLLMLADAMGFRLPGGMHLMSIFWPLMILLLGAGLVLSAVLRRSVTSEQASVDLGGASEASLRISHGAGELHIAGGAGMSQLLTGSFAGGLVQSSRREGNRLDVRLNPPAHPFSFMPPFDGYVWDVKLNQDVPMTLTLQMGANKAVVDLSEVRVTALKVETGASETHFTLPRRGRLRADFELGAASLTIRIPEGMAARVRASHGVSDVKVDPARFPRAGEYYQSPGFETASDTVELHIEAGAAEVKVL